MIRNENDGKILLERGAPFLVFGRFRWLENAGC